MDEVGRGTGSLDGFSLAWAILRYIHDEIGCRTLFATHYHSLTDRARQKGLYRLGMYRMEVETRQNQGSAEKEEGREGGVSDLILFTHRVVPGVQRESYGIHVAQLAGT
jgi:DNA mismatch repair protein MutS